MIVIGVVLAAVAAFVVSSVYYATATPLERRALGDAALDRGDGDAEIGAIQTAAVRVRDQDRALSFDTDIPTAPCQVS